MGGKGRQRRLPKDYGFRGGKSGKTWEIFKKISPPENRIIHGVS